MQIIGFHFLYFEFIILELRCLHCIIRLPEDFDDPAFSTVTIQRDLFYGYDTLMENVSDPSHIEFAHHKVDFLLFFLAHVVGTFYK